MKDFKSGDMVAVKVDVTARVVYQNNDGTLDLVFPGGNDVEYFPQEFVTHADPESWPPQAGDIWEAEGREYFAYVSPAIGLTVFSFDGQDLGDPASYSASKFDDFKVLNPRLIRRRENG